MRNKIIFCALAAALLFLVACTHRVQVDPIHITVDVNIKVDRALDDFFGDIDQTGAAAETAPATD